MSQSFFHVTHLCGKHDILVATTVVFPHSSVSKEPDYNAGGLGSIPGSGRSPGEGNGNPLQYSCLEISHGQISLAGYSP